MILLDLGVALLLVLTIGFCVRLNRRMVELHRGKTELSRLFKQFETVVFRAEQSIQELKAQSTESSELLANTLSQSKMLVEHLGALLQKSNKTYTTLEGALQKGRVLLEEVGTSQAHLQNTLHALEKIQKPAATRSVSPYQAATLPRPQAPAQHRSPAFAFQDSKPTPLEKMDSPALKKVAIETLLERIASVNNSNS